MSSKGENQNKLAKLPRNIFSLQAKNYGKNLRLRAKAEAVLKPKFKMKIA